MGTTTSALLGRLNDALKNQKPKMVISMMGVNDAPGWWYKEFSLIKEDNAPFKFKTFALLKILFNFRSLMQAENSAPINPSSLDYSDPDRLIAELQKHEETSLEYQNLQAQIEKFLEPKSDLEKAKFYSHLSRHMKPPDEAPAHEFKKSYNFLKESFKYDATIDLNLAIGFNFSQKLNQKSDCRIFLAKALEQHVRMSETALINMTHCLSDDKDLIDGVLAAQGSPFVFDTSNEIPTLKNYQNIYKLTVENNICWIAMSYPREKPQEAILQLQKLNKNEDKFFVVDNFQIFDDYLKAHAYEDVFFDRFANQFGHLTEKGAELISNNLLKTLEQIERNHLCGF